MFQLRNTASRKTLTCSEKLSSGMRSRFKSNGGERVDLTILGVITRYSLIH